MKQPAEQDPIWTDAMVALRLYAADRAGLGGIALRAQAGPVRDRFLALLPGPVTRMPASIDDDALAGGLDLAATLRTGRAVTTNGLLARAAGGTLLAAMAERQSPALAARLGAALDTGAGFGVVALDEGLEPDEATRPALLDRLAFHIDLAGLSHRHTGAEPPGGDDAEAAAARLEAGLEPGVDVGLDVVEALCRTAVSLGIASPRACLLAVRAARASAALAGRETATMEDAALAARLVLAPRATRLPEQEETSSEPSDAQPPPDKPKESSGADAGESGPAEGGDMVLEAAQAAIPKGLLARLTAGAMRAPAGRLGISGARQKAGERGRRIGIRAAKPGPGARLNLFATLLASAPWQRLRGREDASPGATSRIKLRSQDFRVDRTEQRARSTTIFMVDASGSAALNRLAEAKGAVELLLADCYQRRDEVAVIAFRGRGAQLLLPPTRSLVRAKRSLATLPGGGGTPLAAALEAGFLLATTVRRSGATPNLVLLTDGRANVTREGGGGRAQAQRDAEQAARMCRAAGLPCLLLDTSPRPGAEAQRLADAMAALYIPLPYASAAGMFGAIRAAGAAQ